MIGFCSKYPLLELSLPGKSESDCLFSSLVLVFPTRQEGIAWHDEVIQRSAALCIHVSIHSTIFEYDQVPAMERLNVSEVSGLDRILYTAAISDED